VTAWPQPGSEGEVFLHTSLHGERIRLEPLDPIHAASLFHIYTEPAVARYLFSPADSRDQFDAIFGRALAYGDSHGMWAVVRRADDAILGRVGFYAFGERERPELAFLLTRSVWGQGIATEACRLAIRYALDERPWPEVVAVVDPNNVAAIRVLEKRGFKPERSFALGGVTAQLFQARIRSIAHSSTSSERASASTPPRGPPSKPMKRTVNDHGLDDAGTPPTTHLASGCLRIGVLEVRASVGTG
jgi:ribosomal-protein-alanine N-acetyltransferase